MKRRDIIISLYRIAITRRAIADGQTDPIEKAFSEGYIHAHENIANTMADLAGYNRKGLRQTAHDQLYDK